MLFHQKVSTLALCRTALSKDSKSHFGLYGSNRMFVGFSMDWTVASEYGPVEYSWDPPDKQLKHILSPAFQNSYQEASNMQFFGNRLGKDAFTACCEIEQPLSLSCAVWHTGCIMCYSHGTWHVKHATFMRETWDRRERNKSVFSSSGLLFPICTKSFSV